MSNFEKEYYEAERFWESNALSDEGNLRRFRETSALIPPDATSVADIGCGNGVFVNYLQQEKPKLDLIAVDRSVTALKYVKTKKKEGDITEIPLDNQSFDCVTCLEVIEHLPVTAFKKALSELCRISKNYVIISVPFAELLEENYTQCPQCRSVFNADLHLQSFSENKMQHLLEEYGFDCVGTKKEGERINFKGHYQFEKFFYPQHFRMWRSPICPICGFTKTEKTASKSVENVSSDHVKSKRSIISYFTAIPKLIWPKEKKYYWIIALYKRKEF